MDSQLKFLISILCLIVLVAILLTLVLVIQNPDTLTNEFVLTFISMIGLFLLMLFIVIKLMNKCSKLREESNKQMDCRGN